MLIFVVFFKKRHIPSTINLVGRKQQTFARLWGTRTERENPNKLGVPLPSKWLSETLSRPEVYFPKSSTWKHPIFYDWKAPEQDDNALSSGRNDIDCLSRRWFRTKVNFFSTALFIFCFSSNYIFNTIENSQNYNKHYNNSVKSIESSHIVSFNSNLEKIILIIKLIKYRDKWLKKKKFFEMFSKSIIVLFHFLFYFSNSFKLEKLLTIFSFP